MSIVTIPPSPFPPSSGKTGDIAERVTDLETNVSTLNTTKASKTDIAGTFNTTTSYTVGDLVYYNGVLYECTTDHVAGAWVAGDFTATDIDTQVNSLMSGLTNLTDDVKLNTQDLTTPSRTKNIMPVTIDVIKSGNTTGTWTDNAYAINGITYTVNTDADGQITDITVSGSASANADLKLLSSFTITKQCILTGCPANGGSSRWYLGIQSYGSDNGEGLTVNANTYGQLYIRVASGVTITTAKQFYPMLRYATITDPTYAPYIPSVESRIEAVESGVTNINTTLENMPMKQWRKNTSGSAENVTFTFSSSVNRYAGLLFCINNSGVSAIFAVAYKEDIEPIITRLAGSDAVTPSISIDGSITVGLYAWSTAILFASGNFV